MSNQNGPNSAEVERDVPTITLDTSVVFDAVSESRPAAVALLERWVHGEVDLAVTTRVAHERRSPATGRLAAHADRLPSLPSPAVWGISKWGEDVYSDYPRPTAPEGDRPHKDAVDADHLEGHRLSGRQYFVTSDKGQLKRARRQGIVAVTPEQMVEILDSRHERRAFVGYPENWDELSEEQKDAACQQMADAMIAALQPQPRIEPDER